jgi:hypothetical protein
VNGVAGISSRLALLPRGIVVEPCPCGPWLLIVSSESSQQLTGLFEMDFSTKGLGRKCVILFVQRDIHFKKLGLKLQLLFDLRLRNVELLALRVRPAR